MGTIALSGSFAVPDRAIAALLLIGSAPSPRRLHVADFLHHCGFATLVTDLGTDEDPALPGTIERLARPIAASLEWLANRPGTRALPIGCLADGAAVAPAMLAIRSHGARVGAFVALNGRIDLAGAALRGFEAPTLLIAGEHSEALQVARASIGRLAVGELLVVESVTDPLADLDALGTVSRQVRGWFRDYLASPES